MNTTIKYLALIPFVLIFSCSLAQDVKWAAIEGGGIWSSESRNSAIVLDKNKNVYAGIEDISSYPTLPPSINGQCYLPVNSAAGVYDATYDKLDSNGNCSIFQYFAFYNATISGMYIDDSSYIYVTGYMQGNISQPWCGVTPYSRVSAFLAKYSPMGSCVWAYPFGSSNATDYGMDVKGDLNGNLYMVGQTYEGISFGNNVSIPFTYQINGFIVKFNGSGVAQWAKQATTSSGSQVIGISNIVNGTYYVTGSFSGTCTFGSFTITGNGAQDIFLAKMDTSGNILWVKQAGGHNTDVGYRVTQDQYCHVFLSGVADSAVQFGSLYTNQRGEFVARYDSSGNVVWLRTLGKTSTSSPGSQPSAVVSDSTIWCLGTFAYTSTIGSYTINSAGLDDIYLCQLDYDGNPLWVTSYGSTANDEGYALTCDSNGAVYISGTFSGTINFGGKSVSPGGTSDAYIVKVNPALQTTNVANGQNMVCRGGSFNVNFTADSSFHSGNVFSVLLSDTAGNFGSPVTIGTVSSTTSGTISCVIPDSIVPGTKYRLMTVASSPVVTGVKFYSNLRISDTIPTLPTLVTPSAATGVCAGQGINLNATSAGNLIYWFTQDTGGTAIGWSQSGANYNIVPSDTPVFYAQAENGCVNPTRVATGVITVNGLPAVPGDTLSSNSPQCYSNGGVTLNASGSAPTGVTWYWETSDTGTNTGNSTDTYNTTPSGNYSIYYRAQNNNSQCWSGGADSLTINVVAPAAPTSVTPTNETECQGVNISLIGTSSGNTINWYKQSTGGTSLGNSASGAGYTVTTDTTRIYYAEALTSAGCKSSTRTATGTITVTPAPAAPTSTSSNAPQCGTVNLGYSTAPSGITYYWESTASGTSTSNSANPTTESSSGTYYARARSSSTGCWSVGATGDSVIVYTIPTTPPIPTSNSPQCASTGVTLTWSGSPPSGIVWYWESLTYGTSGSLGSSSTFTTTSVGSPWYCARAYNPTTGCWSNESASNGLYVGVYANPAAPTSVTPSSATSVCAGIPFNLNATSSGNTINWFTSSSGGTSFGSSASGVNYSYTPTSTGAVYAQAEVASTGCLSTTRTATSTITVKTSPTASASNNSPICSGKTLTLTGDPGSQTSYAWSGPGSYTSSSQSPTVSSNATTAIGGTYTITVTNSVSCTATASTNVTVTSVPAATATNSGPYCTYGTISLTGGPDSMSIYSWAGPNSFSSTSQNPTLSASGNGGTYILTVTNSNGCSATASTGVAVNSPPTATATNTGPYCMYGTISLTGGPNSMGSYSWAGPNSFSSASQDTTLSASGNGGTYTLTVTNSNGCSATASTSVTVNSAPIASASNNSPVCSGQALSLTGGPASMASYAWSGPSSYSSSSQSPTVSSSATAAMSGIYTLMVTNSNGCTATATTNATVNTPPIATASNTGPYCTYGTISLSGGPDSMNSYSWAGPNSFTSTIQNPTLSATGNGGTYFLIITDRNDCSASASTIVTVNTPPTATAANTGPYCSYGTISLIGGPNSLSTYSWAGPNSFSSTSQDTIHAANGNGGTYTLTVTNSSGCSATASTSVTVNSAPIASASNNSPVCSGQALSLTGGPASMASYAWNGPSSYSSSSQSPTVSSSATTAMSGTYTLTVTNSNGCSATATTNATVNTPPIATASNTGPYCSYGTISLSGGLDSMNSYSWAGPNSFTSTIQNPTLSATGNGGTYSVTLTNSNGCSATVTTIVVVDTVPSVPAAPYNKYICSNTPYTFVFDSIVAGSGADEIEWATNNSFTDSIVAVSPIDIIISVASGSDTTIYYRSIISSTGCMSSTIATRLNVYSLPIADAGRDTAICPGSSAVLGGTVVASGGNGGLHQYWSNSVLLNDALIANPTAKPLSNTTFILTVVDQLGCTATDTQLVSILSTPTANAGRDTTICIGFAAQIGLQGDSSNRYSYFWSNGYSLNNDSSADPIATPSESTAYTLVVTDSNGCTASGTVNVHLFPTPWTAAPVFTNAPYIVCKGGSACYRAAAPGNTSLTYSIVNGQATVDSITGCVSNALSNFTIRATAIYPCTSGVTDLNVSVSPAITISPLDTTVLAGDTVVIKAAGGITYSWPSLNRDTSVVIVSPSADSTLYKVSITDGYGCTDSAIAIVRTVDSLQLTVSVLTSTVYPLDSTRILIHSNLPNIPIGWSRNNIDSVSGPAYGTVGNVVDLYNTELVYKFSNITDASQPVTFNFASENTDPTVTVIFAGQNAPYITVSASPNVVNACITNLTITTTFTNFTSPVDGSYYLLQTYPAYSTVSAPPSDDCNGTGTFTPVTGVIPGTHLGYAIFGITQNCTKVSDAITLACPQPGVVSNIISTYTGTYDGTTFTPACVCSCIVCAPDCTDPTCLPMETDYALQIIQPTLTITPPAPEPSYALIGNMVNRTWKICNTGGEVSDLSITYTPENEISNETFTFSSEYYDATQGKYVGAGPFTANITPGVAYNPASLPDNIWPSLFPSLEMNDGDCLYIMESATASNCTTSPSTTNLDVTYTCADGSKETCYPSSSANADVQVIDDYDAATASDNSPPTVTDFHVWQGTTDVTLTGGIDVCSTEPISFQYTITNPTRSNTNLPINANYKLLQTFTNHIDPCWFTGMPTVSMSSLTCTTQTWAGCSPSPTVAWTNGVLAVSFNGCQMPESSSFVLTIGGLTFDPTCASTCTLPPDDYIIGYDQNISPGSGASLSYQTMCHTQITPSVCASGNYGEPYSTNYIGTANPVNASLDDEPYLTFCLDQAGAINPWTNYNDYPAYPNNTFFDCPNPNFEIQFTMPTAPTPSFTLDNNSVSFTSYSGVSSAISSSSISVDPQNSNVYIINDPSITSSGCLSIGVIFSGVGCTPDSYGDAIFTAQIVAVCDPANTSCANNNTFCIATATATVSYECSGICTGTGIGTLSMVKPVSLIEPDYHDPNYLYDIHNQQLIAERITNAAPPASDLDLFRAYPCDEIFVEAVGKGFSGAFQSPNPQANFVYLHLTYDTFEIPDPYLFTVEDAQYAIGIGNTGTWTELGNNNNGYTNGVNGPYAGTGNDLGRMVIDAYLPGGTCNGNSGNNSISEQIVQGSQVFYVRLKLLVKDDIYANHTSPNGTGVYDLQNVQGQMCVLDCRGDISTDIHTSCDPRSSYLELIQHDYVTTAGFIAADDDEPYNEVDMCTQRLVIRTEATGGLVQSPEMPNETRPLLVWPDYSSNSADQLTVTPDAGLTVVSDGAYYSYTNNGVLTGPLSIDNSGISGNYTFFGPTSTTSWPSLGGKIGSDYWIELEAPFTRTDPCNNNPNPPGVTVNMSYWSIGKQIPGITNSCEDPATYLAAAENSTATTLTNPITNEIIPDNYVSTTTSSDYVQLLTDQNGNYTNNAQFEPDANSAFAFQSELKYSSDPTEAPYTWIYPVFDNNVTLSMNGNALTSKTYYPITVALTPGVPLNVNFTGTVNTCVPGTYGITFYTGYTCNPSGGPETGGTIPDLTTGSPTQDACGIIASTVDIILNEPSIDISGCTQCPPPNQTVPGCPTTVPKEAQFGYLMTATGGPIYQPDCVITPDGAASLQTVTIKLICDGATISTSAPITGFTCTGWRDNACNYDLANYPSSPTSTNNIYNFLSGIPGGGYTLNGAGFLPEGCSLYFYATFTDIDGSNGSADIYFAGSGTDRCGNFIVAPIQEDVITFQEVTQNSSLSGTQNGWNVDLCNGAAVITENVAFGATPYTYSWSGVGNSFPNNPATTVNTYYTATVTDWDATGGTFGVTVTDADNCSITASITIGPPDLAVSATISGGGTACAGATLPAISIALTGTEPWSLTYAIDGIDQTPITGITTNPYSFNATTTGTYTVTAVSDYTCTGTFSGSATVTVNPRPTSVISGTATICNGGSTTLSIAFTGTGPWNFMYTNGTTPVSATTSTNPFTVSVSPSATTTYTVTELGDYYCTAQSSDMNGSAVVTVSQLVINTAVGVTDVNYITGTLASIDVDVTGGSGDYSYDWNPNKTGNPISNLIPNSYSVTVTDNDYNGCSATATYIIGANNPNNYCLGDQIGTTNYTYTYTSSTGSTVNLSTSDDPSLGNPSLPAISTLPSGTTIVINSPNIILGATAVTLTDLNIQLGPGSQIFVADGQTLNIASSYLSACTDMWNGISVEDGGTITAYGTRGHGNPEISDAITAVDFQGCSDFGFVGVQFVNNLVGIHISCLSGNTYAINRCTFTSSSTGLKAPYSGQLTERGIELSAINTADANAFTIGYDVNGNPSGIANTFNNIECGIYSNSFPLYIYNNTFSNISKGSGTWTGAGTAIYAVGVIIVILDEGTPVVTGQPCTIQTASSAVDESATSTFSNCDTAIYIHGMIPTVLNNRMDNVINCVKTDDCAGSIQIEGNYFTATDYGISLINNIMGTQNISYNSITVNDPTSQFVTIHTLGLPAYEYVTLNTYGIYQAEMNNTVLSYTSIQNDTIWNGRNCIELNNVYGTAVLNNTLHQYSTTAIYGPQAGIYASNCVGLGIYSNTIDGNNNDYYDALTSGYTSGAPSAYRKSGISLSNTTSADICNNTLGGTTTGTGIGYGALFNANCSPTEVFSNTMYQSKFGVTLQAAGSGPIISDQGSNGPPPYLTHQNSFIGSGSPDYSFSGSYRTYNFANTSVSNRPIFWYTGSNAASNPLYCYPDGAISIDAAIFSDPITNSPVGYNLCATDIFPVVVSHYQHRMRLYEAAVASDSAQNYMDPEYTTTGPWLAERMLYNALIGDTATLNNDSLQQAFYTNTSPLDIGIISRYESALQQMNNNAWVLDLITDPPTPVFDSPAYQYGLAQATNVFDSIPTANAQAANYVAVNNIYLQMLSTGVDTFTTAQLKLLDSIAAQCPYTAGDAVYIARSLYALADNSTFYDDAALCPSASEDRADKINTPQQSSPSAEFVNIYPNPARDVINLIYYAQTVGQVELIITDQLGEKIKDEKIPEGINFEEYSTELMSSGVYYWKLKDSTRTIKTGKIVIIK